MSNGDPGPALLGRRTECDALDRLLESVRAGQSRVLVVRGEAGAGKSALLEYLAARASGCRIARAAGVESELELAYAGLHQLCAPLLDRRERRSLAAWPRRMRPVTGRSLANCVPG